MEDNCQIYKQPLLRSKNTRSSIRQTNSFLGNRIRKSILFYFALNNGLCYISYVLCKLTEILLSHWRWNGTRKELSDCFTNSPFCFHCERLYCFKRKEPGSPENKDS